MRDLCDLMIDIFKAERENEKVEVKSRDIKAYIKRQVFFIEKARTYKVAMTWCAINCEKRSIDNITIFQP